MKINWSSLKIKIKSKKIYFWKKNYKLRSLILSIHSTDHLSAFLRSRPLTLLFLPYSAFKAVSAKKNLNKSIKTHSYFQKKNTMSSSKLSLSLFLLVLLTTHLRPSEAGVSLKLKKLLKKALLLRALSPKKSIAILPIPIPLELLKKELGKLLPKMPEMPPKMPEMPYSYHMPWVVFYLVFNTEPCRLRWVPAQRLFSSSDHCAKLRGIVHTFKPVQYVFYFVFEVRK